MIKQLAYLHIRFIREKKYKLRHQNNGSKAAIISTIAPLLG